MKGKKCFIAAWNGAHLCDDHHVNHPTSQKSSFVAAWNVAHLCNDHHVTILHHTTRIVLLLEMVLRTRQVPILLAVQPRIRLVTNHLLCFAVSIVSVMLPCSYNRNRLSASFPWFVIIMHQQPLFSCLLVQFRGLWQLVVNMCMWLPAHTILPEVKTTYTFL